VRAIGFDLGRAPARHAPGRRESGELAARPRRSRRPWVPRWTLRLRLTLLYGALFLLTGAVLLGITYGLVAQSASHTVAFAGEGPLPAFAPDVAVRLPLPQALSAERANGAAVVYRQRSATGPGFVHGGQAAKGALTVQLRQYTGKLVSVAQAAIRGLSSAGQVKLRKLAARANKQLVLDRGAQLDALLTKSGVALGIMAFVSVGLGWLMAGRALRPVRTMNARARGISERNLHERLGLEGPEDELKELGDTFDGLLARLQGAFESQRRFVSNASHELRTPITVQRTLVEVALSDPDATIESLRATCERVIVAGEQQERLIEALLTLARSQRGLDRREPLELGEVVGEVLQGFAPRDVRITVSLEDAHTAGDPALVERLVANLVQNALHYNRAHGLVAVWTGLRDGSATLEVTNTGPAVAPDQVKQLFEPFRRHQAGLMFTSAATSGRDRLGLGLSIVKAIADAHGAVVTAIPGSQGGLRLRVSFPAVPVALEAGVGRISNPLEHDQPPAAYASGR
jgi:signal transduction histidine kinase